MFDTITTIVLALLGALIAFDAFQKWRKSKSVWYLLAAIMGLLSAIAAFMDWSSSIYGSVLALILYLIGRNRKK